MFNPGAIRRITLTNFITHGYLEVYPGPKLNLILGSNGSGKSSIVAGIILGLGGTPKVIGRGDKISDYIKHGRNSATIAIELQGMRADKKVSITRTIDIRDKSTWMIEGKVVNASKVQEIISEYNMQVDNLCQFLPQDRVAEFATMNKQQLLQETMKALCRTDLLDQQKKLIEDRKNLDDLNAKIERDAHKLDDYKQRYARLGGRVKNLKKRREIVNELEHVQRKKAWTKYTEKNSERLSIKDERDLAQKQFERFQEALRPFQKAIATEKQKFEKTNALLANMNKEIECIQSNIGQKQQTFNTFLLQYQSVKDEQQNALATFADKQVELNATKVYLQQCQKEKKDVAVLVQRDKVQLSRLKEEISEHDVKIKALQVKCATFCEAIASKRHEIASLNNQKQSFERLATMRLNFLQKVAPDAHTATLWLRQNKHLFQSEVYEPIMLEINIFKQQHAKYVENSISFRDKVAFLCTNKEDVAVLNEHVCKRLGLRINVLFQHAQTAPMQSSVKIEVLRTFGFTSYVNSLFTAPAPIMQYLCRTSNLHNIPISFGDSDINPADVPVNLFYKGNYRMFISISKYSKKKSFSQSQIVSDKSLSYCIDSAKIEMIDHQLQELSADVTRIQADAQAINEQIKDVTIAKAAVESRLPELHVSSQNSSIIDKKITNLELKFAQLTQQTTNGKERIAEEMRTKLNQIAAQICKTAEQINDDFNAYSKTDVKSQLERRAVACYRERLQPLEDEVEEHKTKVKEASSRVQQVRSKLSEVTHQARDCLNAAKQLSNGFTPDDEGFNAYRPQYDTLPEVVDELDELRERLNERLASVCNLADEEEMAEYEECSKKIQELDARIGHMKTEHTQNSSKIIADQEAWLEPLEELLTHINEIFSKSFKSMRCVGDVKMWKGEDENQYEKYGICIRVTYRNDSPLQELNSTTQSGGERAVATAVYMISMQELTPVPFRCVDEINQGMDSSNERRIFELLGYVTSKPESGQFFMVSPKMVPEMNFTDSVTIIIIHNSDSVNANQKDWHREWNRSLTQ